MKEGDIYIYGIISPYQDDQASQWGEVNLKDVRDQLKANADADTLNVHIRSEGGAVDDGWAIHDMLVNSGKKINTIGEGIVASIATVVFLAGENRYMSANAEFMIHNPWNMGIGTSNDFQKMADELAKAEDHLISFYADKTGQKADDLRAWMDEETFMTAEEAVSRGFATEIAQQLKAVALINHNTNKMEVKELESKVDQKIDSLWDKIAKALNLKSNALTLTTATAEILDFGSEINDESQIVEGVSAKVGDKAADGEYLMPSGRTFTFEQGKLTKVVEPAQDKVKDLEETIKDLNTKLEAKESENSTLKQENETVKQSIEGLKNDLETVKAELKSDISGFNKEHPKPEGGQPENRFSKLREPAE